MKLRLKLLIAGVIATGGFLLGQLVSPVMGPFYQGDGILIRPTSGARGSGAGYSINLFYPPVVTTLSGYGFLHLVPPGTSLQATCGYGDVLVSPNVLAICDAPQFGKGVFQPYFAK